MADAYQLETTADRYLLEDGSGVYLLEPVAADVFIEGLHKIHCGVVAITAAGMNGVLET